MVDDADVDEDVEIADLARGDVVVHLAIGVVGLVRATFALIADVEPSVDDVGDDYVSGEPVDAKDYRP